MSGENTSGIPLSPSLSSTLADELAQQLSMKGINGNTRNSGSKGVGIGMVPPRTAVVSDNANNLNDNKNNTKPQPHPSINPKMQHLSQNLQHTYGRSLMHSYQNNKTTPHNAPARGGTDQQQQRSNHSKIFIPTDNNNLNVNNKSSNNPTSGGSSNATTTEQYSSMGATHYHIHHHKFKSNFMPADLYSEMALKQASIFYSLTPEELKAHGIPEFVDNYHTLYPLYDVLENTSLLHNGPAVSFFQLPTTLYKAISVIDSDVYCLCRLKGYRLLNERAMMVIDQWRSIQHSSIVLLHEAFTTKDFNDHSLVFVYDYYPQSRTLMDMYLNPNLGGTEYIDESTIWSFIIQLTSALKTIHASGLACRNIHPSKIIVTNKNRVKISCTGILDLLSFDQTDNAVITHCQQEDFVMLGQLILSLACGNTGLVSLNNVNLSAHLEHVSMNFSPNLKGFIIQLLRNPNRGQQIQNGPRLKSASDFMPMIGARFYSELESTSKYAENITNVCNISLENGRLFRILCKLSFINERPEFQMDPRWSETGDRYLLKLFRDYVFHQVTENNEPSVSLAHAIQCLNKLDVGSPERICLTSRDELTVLVVTYKDLKKCLDMVFKEINDASNTAKYNSGSNIGGGGGGSDSGRPRHSPNVDNMGRSPNNRQQQINQSGDNSIGIRGGAGVGLGMNSVNANSTGAYMGAGGVGMRMNENRGSSLLVNGIDGTGVNGVNIDVMDHITRMNQHPQMASPYNTDQGHMMNSGTVNNNMMLHGNTNPGSGGHVGQMNVNNGPP